MATKILKSLKGRRMRLTRLDECGDPVVGSCSSIVTSGFIKVELSLETEDGEEYQSKNAWGDYCVNEKDRPRNKWGNIMLEMCEINPDALDIIAGAAAITDGTDTIGASFGPDGSTAAFAIEVWTKASGAECQATPEYGYFVAPYVINGNLEGPLVIENGVMSLSMKGEAIAATSDWGVNPYADNPLLTVAGFPVGDFFALVRTTVAPPTETTGCVALA